MTRTTILLDSELLFRIKQLARTQGKTMTAIIREALLSYLSDRLPAQKRFSFTGVGKGKMKNVSQDADEIIKRNLNPVEGFGRGNHR
jgi:predicted DNA-binding protein